MHYADSRQMKPTFSTLASASRRPATDVADSYALRRLIISPLAASR
jgi:hypothetical protein